MTQRSSAAKLGSGEPAGRFVLDQVEIPGDYAARVAAHRQVKRRIIILYRVDQMPDADLCLQLFPDFTTQSVLRALPSLDFPARELPVVFPLAIAPLGGENRVSPADDGGNYFDGFHWNGDAVTS